MLSATYTRLQTGYCLYAVHHNSHPCNLSYTPHTLFVVLQALLHTAGTAATLLPWAPRLCLLHACLADGTTSAERRWRWLPTAADSLCSQALQALTKQGSSTSSRSSSNGKGKRRAPDSTATNGPATVNGSTHTSLPEDLIDEPFSSAVVARVCSDLATAGTGTTLGNDSATGSFLSGYSRGVDEFSSGVAPSIAGGFVWRERGDDWLQGYRFKLQALRDTLLGGAEAGKGHGVGHNTPSGPTVADERGAVHDVDVRRGVVERALETSRCGEAFILAVQVRDSSCTRPLMRFVWVWEFSMKGDYSSQDYFPGL